MQLTGRDGIRIDDVWQDGPHAHQTVAIPGFPNFFMMLGPHSPVGNFPLTAVAESQAEHIVQWIKRWRHGEFDTMEPKSAATEAYNTVLRAAMPNTVWTTGCDSWYLNKDGIPEVWPLHRPNTAPCSLTYIPKNTTCDAMLRCAQLVGLKALEAYRGAGR